MKASRKTTYNLRYMIACSASVMQSVVAGEDRIVRGIQFLETTGRKLGGLLLVALKAVRGTTGTEVV